MITIEWSLSPTIRELAKRRAGACGRNSRTGRGMRAQLANRQGHLAHTGPHAVGARTGESAVLAGAAQAVPGEVGEGGVAIYGHDQVRFGEDAAQDVDHAFGAADGEAVGVGPADGDRGGAQGQGLDHIGAGADAGIEEDGQAVGGVHHGGQAIKRRQPAVGLPATVV